MSDGVSDCGIIPASQYVILEPMDEFANAEGIVLPQAYDDATHGDAGDFIRERNQLCLSVVRGVGPGPWRWPTKGGVQVGPPWRDRPPVELGEQVMYLRANAVPVDGTDLVLVPDVAIFFAVAGKARQVADGIVSA